MTTEFTAESDLAQSQTRVSLQQLNRRLLAWMVALAFFAIAFWIAFVTEANVFLLQACVLGTAVGALWTLHRREQLTEAMRSSER